MGSTHFLVVWMEVWDGLGSTPGEYSSNMRVRLLRRNLADGAAPLGLRTPNLIPSPPLHSTALSDRRRPAPSPASPPGSRSAGLAPLKALVWFWLIDETLSANLVYQDDYEIGSTTPSDEAMTRIMIMVIAW